MGNCSPPIWTTTATARDDWLVTVEERFLSAYIRTVWADAAFRESRAALEPGDPAASEDACRSLGAEVLRLQSEREEGFARLAPASGETDTGKAARQSRQEPSADWLTLLRQFHGFVADYPTLCKTDPVLADALQTALRERAAELFPLPIGELLPIAAEAILLESVREDFLRLDDELRQALASPAPASGEQAALIKEQLSRQVQHLSRLLMEAA